MEKTKNPLESWLAIFLVITIFVLITLYAYDAEHHDDGLYISRRLDGSTIYEKTSDSKAYVLEKMIAGKQITLSKVNLPDSDLCGIFPFPSFTLVQIKGNSARIITYH